MFLRATSVRFDRAYSPPLFENFAVFCSNPIGFGRGFPQGTNARRETIISWAGVLE